MCPSVSCGFSNRSRLTCTVGEVGPDGAELWDSQSSYTPAQQLYPTVNTIGQDKELRSDWTFVPVGESQRWPLLLMLPTGQTGPKSNSPTADCPTSECSSYHVDSPKHLIISSSSVTVTTLRPGGVLTWTNTITNKRTDRMSGDLFDFHYVHIAFRLPSTFGLKIIFYCIFMALINSNSRKCNFILCDTMIAHHRPSSSINSRTQV